MHPVFQEGLLNQQADDSRCTVLCLRRDNMCRWGWCHETGQPRGAPLRSLFSERKARRGTGIFQRELRYECLQVTLLEQGRGGWPRGTHSIPKLAPGVGCFFRASTSFLESADSFSRAGPPGFGQTIPFRHAR